MREVQAADKALEPLENVQCRCLESGFITYKSAISACEKGKQLVQALEVFEVMHKQGAVPDVVTYNALISACEKGMQPTQALEVFEVM